jgi:hypothetical protein
VVPEIAAWSRDANCDGRNGGLFGSDVVAEIEACWKYVKVWQQNWLFVGSGLVAKIAAYSKYVKVWQQHWLLVRRGAKV